MSLDFLDAYLKHDRHALDRLRHDANVPGLATLQIDVAAERAYVSSRTPYADQSSGLSSVYSPMT